VSKLAAWVNSPTTAHARGPDPVPCLRPRRAASRIDEEFPYLSLGVVVGGVSGDAKHWGDAVMALDSDVFSLLQSGADPPVRLNIVFQVAGEGVKKLDFSGIRTGRFSKLTRMLMMQVAIEEEFPGEEAARQLLCRRVEESVREAKKYLYKRS
jgi:hypothetical protein